MSRKHKNQTACESCGNTKKRELTQQNDGAIVCVDFKACQKRHEEMLSFLRYMAEMKQEDIERGHGEKHA